MAQYYFTAFAKKTSRIRRLIKALCFYVLNTIVHDVTQCDPRQVSAIHDHNVVRLPLHSPCYLGIHICKVSLSFSAVYTKRTLYLVRYSQCGESWPNIMHVFVGCRALFVFRQGNQPQNTPGYSFILARVVSALYGTCPYYLVLCMERVLIV